MFNRLYIHIPFCLRKCPYCAFVSRESGRSDLEGYVTALLDEMRLAALQDAVSGQLESIYLGGGTPSLLTPLQIERLLLQAEKLFGLSGSAEITLEANPGTVDRAKLAGFRSAGTNRLSIGVQSFDDEMLKLLGRVHSAGQALEAFAAARSAGFNNIGIDLIHALPGQTGEMWQRELLQALELSPEHLSIYGLTIEEDTPFSIRYHDETMLPDEDKAADMFETADRILTAAGYEHYEIANYARPGRRSQHNSGYWRRDGYLGLGAGAHSFMRGNPYGIRFGNTPDIDRYAQTIRNGRLPRIDETMLSRDDAMAEFMFLGLRMADGVSTVEFHREFGATLHDVFGKELEELRLQGLLATAEDRIRLTLTGLLLSNRVFSAFLK